MSQISCGKSTTKKRRARRKNRRNLRALRFFVVDFHYSQNPEQPCKSCLFSFRAARLMRERHGLTGQLFHLREIARREQFGLDHPAPATSNHLWKSQVMADVFRIYPAGGDEPDVFVRRADR